VITDYKDGKNEDKKDKRTIMITSRVHPGETMASYMMEYMIDYLTGKLSFIYPLIHQYSYQHI